MRWITYTVETELLLNEIQEAVTRVSTLVGAAKQYSALDRAPHQDVYLHFGLDSTLVMLGGKLGNGVTVERDLRARSAPGETVFEVRLPLVVAPSLG